MLSKYNPSYLLGSSVPLYIFRLDFDTLDFFFFTTE